MDRALWDSKNLRRRWRRLSSTRRRGLGVDSFNFVFSLFGLLLGFALAEVFGGFGRALQSRRKIRIGWQSPLLGLIVAFDLTSFWAIAWAFRDRVVVHIFVLFCGLAVTGLYYLAARLVFPDDPGEWPDYDVYYSAHKQYVLGGVVACNAIAQAAQIALGFDPFAGTYGKATAVLFYAPIVAAMWVRPKAANLALLAFILVQYPVFSLVEFVRP
jgi:hypothetical protein